MKTDEIIEAVLVAAIFQRKHMGGCTCEKLAAAVDRFLAIGMPVQAQARPSWIPPGDHFVMVIEDDRAGFNGIHYDFDAYGMPVDRNTSGPGPMTWEHYLGQATTLAAVKNRIKQLDGRYGRAAIARLEFYL
jgi:hypothetical protein